MDMTTFCVYSGIQIPNKTKYLVHIIMAYLSIKTPVQYSICHALGRILMLCSTENLKFNGRKETDGIR